MDVDLEKIKDTIEPQLMHFGRKKTEGTAEKVLELMNTESFRATTGGRSPMIP